jgi:hypothetical protein
MIHSPKAKTRFLLIMGFVGAQVGAFVGKEVNEQVGIAIFFICYLVFLIGSLRYAKEKGYSTMWGMLGILQFAGFVVLWLLPDRINPEGQEKWKRGKHYALKFMGVVMLFTAITNFPDDVENRLPSMSTGEQVWFVVVSVLWITASIWLILRKRKSVVEMDTQRAQV